jgi:TonB family protein
MTRSWFSYLLQVLVCHLLMLFYFHLENLPRFPTETKEQLKIKLLDETSSRDQIVRAPNLDEIHKPTDPAFLSDRDRRVNRQRRSRAGSDSASRPHQVELSDLNPFAGEGHPLKTKKTSSSPSRTNDFLENIPPGDLTYLNTIEYKYYGFFHRIRQKIEQFWGRSLKEKAEQLLQEGRRLATDELLITGLVVTLSPEGVITHIRIKGSSGVLELDEAAVEAFNHAGPFPNPPKGLVKNGKVEIEWGFVVDT